VERKRFSTTSGAVSLVLAALLLSGLSGLQSPVVGGGHEQGAHQAPAGHEVGAEQAAGHDAAGGGDETEAAHEAHGTAAHDAGGHSGGEGHFELPNLIHMLRSALAPEGAEEPAWLGYLARFQDIFFALLVTVLLIVVARLGTRRMSLVPGPVQNVVEFFVEGFRDFILGIMGPQGEPFVPFLGTLFLYIWWMNLFGLVPLMKSPTSALSTTGALAVCVFLYVQWTGIRRLGLLGYIKHLAGDPKDAIGWALVPLMLPLHIIGELAKPVSLSLRLFGNITGEDVLIAVFAMLGVAVLGFLHLPVGLPLHLPFILLALMMSTVQALVFTLLSAIYIVQVLPHEEHEEHGEAVDSEAEETGSAA